MKKLLAVLAVLAVLGGGTYYAKHQEQLLGDLNLASSTPTVSGLPAAATCTVSASPNPAVVGQSITLSWSSQNATTASWAQAVPGTSDFITQVSDPAPTSGSQTILAKTAGNAPLTLMVQGPGGNGSCSVVVPVSASTVGGTSEVEGAASLEVVLPQSLFSFDVPSSWKILESSFTKTQQSIIFTNDRGDTLFLSCPPIESNYESIEHVRGTYVSFMRDKTFSQGTKTYTLTYFEYAPATGNVAAVLLKVTGGQSPMEDCKLGTSVVNANMSGDTTTAVQDMVNAAKVIYASWK